MNPDFVGVSQRNYIYYNISPSNSTGTLSDNFKESVVGFTFSTTNSTPYLVLGFLTYANVDHRMVAYPWTSGQLDFRLTTVSFLDNVPVSTKYFSAYPQALFEVSYTQNGNVFVPSISGFKLLPLNIPLMVWDLEHYSPAIKISVCMLRSSGTVTTTTDNTVITYNMGDYVEMGDAVVDFDSPVIIGSSVSLEGVHYKIQDHSTGICPLNAIPVNQY
jgi:hypothetical protein